VTLAARLVAADVKVVLHPADGVTIEDVYGNLFERVGRDVVVSLPDMASTTHQRVLARLTVSPSAGQFPVLDVVATFADVATDRARASSLAPTLTARATASSEEVARLEDKEVLTYGINGRGIADARRAIELNDQGRREEALRMLERAHTTVAVANKDLNSRELTGSIGTFSNLRALFSSSANALGGGGRRERALRHAQGHPELREQQRGGRSELRAANRERERAGAHAAGRRAVTEDRVEPGRVHPPSWPTRFSRGGRAGTTSPPLDTASHAAQGTRRPSPRSRRAQDQPLKRCDEPPARCGTPAPPPPASAPRSCRWCACTPGRRCSRSAATFFSE
jgi:hypothetical protein